MPKKEGVWYIVINDIITATYTEEAKANDAFAKSRKNQGSKGDTVELVQVLRTNIHHQGFTFYNDGRIGSNNLAIEGYKEQDLSNIAQIFEGELGRALTPVELKFIKEWLDLGHSKEMIMEAIARSASKMVLNFKYIGAILKSWADKGIQTMDGVLADDALFKASWNNKKKSKKDNPQ